MALKAADKAEGLAFWNNPCVPAPEPLRLAFNGKSFSFIDFDAAMSGNRQNILKEAK
jgi:hypothetical protein